MRTIRGLLASSLLGIAAVVTSQVHAASNDEHHARQPAYISSAQCSACHADAAAAWKDSDHGWAWREPTSENVLGDFDGTTFENKGVTSRFSTRDGKYFVETDGPDGNLTEYEVKYAVGVKPLQQYLVDTGGGRLQALDLAWDIEQERWYHLYPDQDNKAGDGLHWTGPYKNWNGRCAECHATGFEKNYNFETRSYASKQAEIGVGCEACHGPGEAHADWAREPEQFEPSIWSGVKPNGLTVQFDADNVEIEIQQCAGCHSRREPFAASSPKPGTKFADNYRLALLRDGLYHADGQNLDEVYVYGSFLQSKMSAAGVTCTNCHEPHTSQLKAEGNALCTQCHSPAGNENFPSLKQAFYDGPEHHFHEPENAGAQCSSCHMPERFYMVVDGRSDHSFRVPRPDISVTNGTPNTCTDCHTDQSAAWAAEQVARRFPNGRNGTPHYGEVFSAARSGLDDDLIARLFEVVRDMDEASIVRATAIDLLRTEPSEDIANAGEVFLQDDSDVVRETAVALQRGAPLTSRAQRIVPLLDDPSRAVRIAAARALIDVTGVRYPPKIDLKFRSAMGEFQSSLLAKTDFPEIQLVLGGTALALRNTRVAERAFSEAVAMDPQLAVGWLTLVRLQVFRRDFAAAERSLERALEADPENGLLHQSLGGVKLAAGKPQEALEPLERASRLMPDNLAVTGDLGMLLSRIGEHSRALELLQSAEIAGYRSPELLLALAGSLLATNNRAAAEGVVIKLEFFYPGHPSVEQARRLLSQ